MCIRDREDIDGLSLMPMLSGEGSNDRDELYFHYPHNHHLGFKPAGAIRMGDYKLIEWFEGTVGGKGRKYSLFNLETDLDESDDLTAEMPALVEEMAAKLRAWRKRVGAGEMTVNPNYDMTRAHWRFEDSQGGDSK